MKSIGSLAKYNFYPFFRSFSPYLDSDSDIKISGQIKYVPLGFTLSGRLHLE